MHEAIKPLVLFTAPNGGRVLVKVANTNTQQTIAHMEKTWQELVPNRPFEYHFIDDDFNELYNSELQLGRAMKLFASIAITLATLGLFGLSSYIVQQRTKEIGIRKVMGASILNILTVTSKNFVILVVLAILFASPVAYWMMKQWLNEFTYRIDVSWWVFLIAGATTITVAILTVSIHGWKASTANPVKSLRSE
jgi:putative ABC transport system permease protein